MKLGVRLQGIVLLLTGVFGAVFVGTYDILMQKPVNDITGPKSITAIVICALFIVMGVKFILRESKK
ncbi:MAG: hypothetical protein JW869_03805 [Candidatus Omnitrophica bacterium]|nr:hypothetical protein [Candidatus Omnitrophota bacterium]